jgi:hypothetical protein
VGGADAVHFRDGASDLAVGGVSARAVRVEMCLPFGGEGAITSLCVQAEPWPSKDPPGRPGRIERGRAP